MKNLDQVSIVNQILDIAYISLEADKGVHEESMGANLVKTKLHMGESNFQGRIRPSRRINYS